MLEETRMSMLDEEAIRAAELRRDPYDFAFVEHAIDEKLKEEVLADAPEIPHRGSYALTNLKYGAKFAACMKDLESLRFRRLVEQKFDVDLTSRPTSIVMIPEDAWLLQRRCDRRGLLVTYPVKY